VHFVSESVFEHTDAVSGSRDGVIERRACFLRRY